MVDIRLFFGGEKPPGGVCIVNCSYSHPDFCLLTVQLKKSSKPMTKELKASKAKRHEPIEVEEVKEGPAKVRKVSSDSKSKYFSEKPPPRKRAAARTSYVNLESDAEDSAEEFKPDEDHEDEEDDDFDEEVLEDHEEEETMPKLEEEDDEDLSILEIKPTSKRAKKPPSPAEKAAKSSPVKKKVKGAAKPKDKPSTSGAAGVNADIILSEIADAELPDAPETDGKMNYFALKSKQQNVAQPTGMADLPEAAPNCLGGLTIVFTGVLPSLDRDAAESLAKRYGSKVTKSISKKTSLVVIGEEAGPSKVKKIKDFGIKAIDENGFLELLRRMPADGGDGANAQAAKKKREEEEQAILEKAMEEEKAEQERERKRKQEVLNREQQIKKEAGSHSAPAPPPPREIPNSEKLWTVKYAPTDITQLCGNKGQVQKLRNWLSNWFSNAKKDFKVGGPDGSGIFRAALISGPPGIGKTSAAHLVAQELGFDILEKNASDVRSKSLLNSTVKSVLNNTSVVGFFKHQHDAEHDVNEKRFCLIMDEVDGMSSGDHGGAGALSAFCRITQMPMILICNDKSLPKMRTFDKVTFDLPFRRPTETEMRSRLLTIALREKLKLDPTVIGQLVQATGNDIRQIINLMSTVSKTQKSIGHSYSQKIAESWKKHTLLKPFAIGQQMLGGNIFNPNSGSNLNDKIEMYFNDIDFTPLMIQENYLLTRPNGALSPADHLKRVAEAADDISLSDQINSLIRSSEQQWSLLPFHAVMSTVKPSMAVNGGLQARVNFTSWLGNNSKTMKYQRLLQELQYHTRLRTSTSKTELRLDYMPVFCERLTVPLLDNGEEGIAEVVDTMDHYYMSREDWDTVLDFGVGNNKGADIVKKIPTKVKSAFTRKYNSAQHPVAIYKTGNSVGGGQAKKQNVDFEDVVEDDTAKDDEEPEAGDSDAIDAKKDKLIKEVKPKKPVKKAAPKKAAPKKKS